MTRIPHELRARLTRGSTIGAARRGGRGAFTLLELLVTIGIIALLAAIVLAVSTAVLRNAEVSQMKAAFQALDEAVGEFERARGQKITFGRLSGDPVGSYDLVELNLTNAYLIVCLLNGMDTDGSSGGPASQPFRPLLVGNDRSLEILKRIDPDLLRRDVPTSTVPPIANVPHPRLELVDPWGARIGVIFPGRAKNPGETGDADGTVRTSDENALGACRDGRILFVSPGPDGNFGTREDNIYSYDPIWPLPPLQ